jgi:hypothetical protein
MYTLTLHEVRLRKRMAGEEKNISTLDEADQRRMADIKEKKIHDAMTKRTAKIEEVKKTVAKRHLGMAEYKAALGGTACKVKQKSRNHRICNVPATKSALNGYVEKHRICGDGVSTRPMETT